MNFAEAFIGPVLVAVALLLCRVGAFLAISPFPANFTTPSHRIGLAVLISVVLGLGLRPQGLPPGFDVRIVLPAFREVLAGAFMGLAHRLVFMSAEICGTGVAASMGLSMPQVLDPHADVQESVMARIFSLAGGWVLISSGAHRVAFAHLLHSFDVLPLGAPQEFVHGAPQLIDLAGRSLAAGVSLSLPVAGVTLVLQLALAMVARSAPQLQLFSVGLGMMMLAGLGTLFSTGADTLAALGVYMEGAARGWVEMPAP